MPRPPACHRPGEPSARREAGRTARSPTCDRAGRPRREGTAVSPCGAHYLKVAPPPGPGVYRLYSAGLLRPVARVAQQRGVRLDLALDEGGELLGAARGRHDAEV